MHKGLNYENPKTTLCFPNSDQAFSSSFNHQLPLHCHNFSKAESLFIKLIGLLKNTTHENRKF